MLNPKDYKIFIKDIAKEVGVHPDLVEDFVYFYYGKVRKCLSDLNHPNIYIENLGTFSIRKTKLRKSINRQKDILGNLDKRNYKGYEKHIAVKEKLDILNKANDLINSMEKKKSKWKDENKKSN